MHTGFWWGNLTRKDYEEALGVNGRILTWILNKLARNGLTWVRIGTIGGCCEEGYEPSDSTKRGEFLEYLTGYMLLPTGSALQNKLVS